MQIVSMQAANYLSSVSMGLFSFAYPAQMFRRGKMRNCLNILSNEMVLLDMIHF